MKFQPEPAKSRFTEVSLKLTFETQHELDALASMFNCFPIAEACREIGIPCEAIRSQLATLGADQHLMPSKWHETVKTYL